MVLLSSWLAQDRDLNCVNSILAAPDVGRGGLRLEDHAVAEEPRQGEAKRGRDKDSKDQDLELHADL